MSHVALARPRGLVQTCRMILSRKIGPLLSAALVLGLSACGFHLRNALVLPPDLGPVKVTARDQYSPLAESLASALERAGAVAADPDAKSGVAVLRIRSEKFASRPISVDERGRAQEYTLLYAVVFSLDRADGTNVVPQQAVELSRDYISVPTNSTGTDSEQELLTREMRKDMTASILRRIDAASRAPMPVEGTSPAGSPSSPRDDSADDTLDPLIRP